MGARRTSGNLMGSAPEPGDRRLGREIYRLRRR